MKKIIVVLLVAMLAVSALAKLQAAQASTYLTTEGTQIDPRVQAWLSTSQPGDMLGVIVTLREQADLSRIGGADRAARQQGIIRALQALADASQKQIQAFLTARAAQGLVGQVDPFWVFNGLGVTATAEVIQELAARADVAKITPNDISIAPSQASSSPETNITVAGAPALWDLGLNGQGIVVANMDSGVDNNHPDLAASWRGGSNSWFDPYGQHSTPFDMSGHGTQTMGVMVGGDAGGTAIGVAPQAQWIAVKIFNDAGSSTATAIHQGFQWLLDPDGNPNTADAPYVVNNSWTFGYPGCDLEFELDLQALRAAGIVSVFAAGNGGPNANTSYSPSNNPAAFAVGATDDSDLLYAYSSRGPSSCGETSTIYPEVVAPGVGIHTSDLFGFYTDVTGTSLAAPHVAGGLALLLSAYPDLTAAWQESGLENSALDLGSPGPDNDFGYGRLDLLAAYQWFQSTPAPTPTPTPAATLAPTPTLTATPDPTVNLALNRTITVSSAQDSAHDGPKAVDGDLVTLWQTAKATGKHKLPSEWIEVDLGANTTIGQVVLEWDVNYATAYNIRVSSDRSTWTTVFNATSGDGGNDTISFNPLLARYIRMESTAWSNSSLRDWLKEFEIYAGGLTPGATATPAPTATATASNPTATPAPTATPTPGSASTMHVGDLDAASSPGAHNRWDAVVTATVHDANESPLAGATVSGSWNNGASGGGSCVTDGTGVCSITKSGIKGNVSSVSLTIDSVSAAGMTYQASANHDPDGDSDGTSITVLAP
jgi:subtilisin family serine protease